MDRWPSGTNGLGRAIRPTMARSSGLADDDHPQYFNLSQNETVTGQPTFSFGTRPFNVSSSTLVTNLNADYLDGFHAGNSSGNIPLSNGTINTNLNADLLDGLHNGV